MVMSSLPEQAHDLGGGNCADARREQMQTMAKGGGLSSSLDAVRW